MAIYAQLLLGVQYWCVTLHFPVGREGFEPPTPCASCKCSAN